MVCSGINYGNGENMLHWLFKQAWHGAASLPVYGTGSNVIPLIHVRDLASIVLNVLDSKPKRKYILAVDQRYCCLSYKNIRMLIQIFSVSCNPCYMGHAYHPIQKSLQISFIALN